jgi:hypothetical protein
MSTKQRKSERVHVYLPVSWENRSGQYEATTADISTGGCFLLTGARVRARWRVELRIRMPSREWVPLKGQVVYTAREIGFGVCFTEVEEDGRAAIAELVEEVRERRLSPDLTRKR